MIRHQHSIWSALFIYCLFIVAGLGVETKDHAPARVKSIVVSPQKADDDGFGVDLLVQVEFVEPAPENDTLRVIIIPGRGNSGEAHWKDGKAVQSILIRRNDTREEVRATIRITKNGTIGIKAKTSSGEENASSIYWIPVTVRPK